MKVLYNSNHVIIVLFTVAGMLLRFSESAGNQVFGGGGRNFLLRPAPKMKWQDGIMDIQDLDEALNSAPDNEETQESLLAAFEELSPEIQDSILYFYDENIRLTDENIKLSQIVGYLLEVFPIKVEVYVQQPTFPNPYMYNFNNYYQPYPGMNSGLGNFYNPPGPPAFAGIPSYFTNGGFGDRDERFYMRPTASATLPYQIGLNPRRKTRGRDSLSHHHNRSDEYSLQELILIFLIQECTEYYKETNSWLPECNIFFNQLFNDIDKEKLEQSLNRISAKRSLLNV